MLYRKWPTGTALAMFSPGGADTVGQKGITEWIGLLGWLMLDGGGE